MQNIDERMINMIAYIKHPEYNRTSSGLPMYEFQIESSADVAALPTMTEKQGFDECVCAGSIAYTANLATVYTLSALNVWTAVE